MRSAPGPSPHRHHILGDLQDEVLRIFFERCDPLRQFALSGGTALAEFYLGHRLSEDLDFFTLVEGVVVATGTALPRAIETGIRGAAVEVLQSSTELRRYRVGTDKESTLIDLGRASPPVLNPTRIIDGVMVESFLDIAAGKLAALLAREEGKDAVDVWAVSNLGGLPLLDLVSGVYEKDPGLADYPQVIADALRRNATSLPRLPAVLTPVDPSEIARFFAEEHEKFIRSLQPRRR